MLAEVVICHEERAVVRVGDVFLKADTNADRIEREVVALAVAPVPAPRVLWHRHGNPHVIAVSEVSGEPLALLGSPSGHPCAAWVAAGRVARTLHRHEVPAELARPSRYLLEDLDELETWLVSRGVAAPSLVSMHARRARVARGAATGGAFVHGDFQPAHVVVTSDHSVAGILDWGDAGLGDPHFDLAVLAVEHSEHLDAVVDGYGDSVDSDRIRGYWSWRRLGSIRWMMEHGFDATGGINALEYDA